MDWKREAAGKLRDYADRKAGLERARAELRRTENEMRRVRSARMDGSEKGGMSSREDALINAIVRKGELERLVQGTGDWLRPVEEALADLSDEERKVLDGFFIHRSYGAAVRLCGELGLEKSAVYDLKDKALRRFTLRLYGAEVS